MGCVHRHTISHMQHISLAIERGTWHTVLNSALVNSAPPARQSPAAGPVGEIRVSRLPFG
jgi:hypothetical protein